MDTRWGCESAAIAGGTLWHTKRAADEALHEAAAQYQSTVLIAYRNVADTLQAINADADALAADTAAEHAAKELLEATQERARSGYTDYLTVLSSAIAYQQSLLTLVQAQATRVGDTAALYQALGGGWWNRASTVAMVRAGGAP